MSTKGGPAFTFSLLGASRPLALRQLRHWCRFTAWIDRTNCQNRRQKVFSRGFTSLCRGIWHSENLVKTPLISSASDLNLGGLGVLGGGSKPTKAHPWPANCPRLCVSMQPAIVCDYALLYSDAHSCYRRGVIFQSDCIDVFLAHATAIVCDFKGKWFISCQKYLPLSWGNLEIQVVRLDAWSLRAKALQSLRWTKI